MGILPTMAYVVGRPNGSWEIRETVASPAGPRSRTLASFRELSEEVVERAIARASKPVTADDLRRAARRAGVPTGLTAVDRAAAELLRELGDGREPHPILRGLLLEALRTTRPVRLVEPRADGDADTDSAERDALPFETPHAALASAAWIGASPERRGATLEELLDFTDAFPAEREARMARQQFPGLPRAA